MVRMMGNSLFEQEERIHKNLVRLLAGMEKQSLVYIYIFTKCLELFWCYFDNYVDHHKIIMMAYAT